MINKDYLYIKKYLDVNEIYLKEDSVFIYSCSQEERSYSIVNLLKIKFYNVSYIEIDYCNDDDSITVKETGNKYYLRDSSSIISLIEEYSRSNIYIDTSGLNARISAALIKNTFNISERKKLDINIVYTEPKKYKEELFNSEGVFQHLSEKIGGIEPLPGFATIIPNTEKIKFVALLGFEGCRFTYLLEQVQPPKNSIIPVIGVPGFRIEYPFIALLGNQLPLIETGSWSNIKYATANSIVDVFFLLKNIMEKPPQDYKIIIAPIGIKPHVIAAILFAIKYPNKVEIVYDNPERKDIRTEGTKIITVCNINSLLGEE